MHDISSSDSGTELHVSLGETLKLRLPENPTTGYRWQVRSSGGPTLELVEDSFGQSTEAFGAGGVRWWIFRAAKEGAANLTLELCRNWEHQAIETFQINVRVIGS